MTPALDNLLDRQSPAISGVGGKYRNVKGSQYVLIDFDTRTVIATVNSQHWFECEIDIRDWTPIDEPTDLPPD